MNLLATHNPTKPLTFAEARELIAYFLNPEADPLVVGAGLAVLAQREPTAEELAAFALELRAVASPFPAPAQPVLDIVGTGGDTRGGVSTANLSTLAALFLPSFGVNVAKHGNRAATSLCGSADVLEALGYDLQRAPALLQRDLAGQRFAFLLASAYHPQLVRLRDIRRRLGVPTIFNLLGPLLNPAQPAHMVLGVARAALLDPMSVALARNHVRRAFVLHGATAEGHGMDEASIEGPTQVVEIVGEKILPVARFTPSDFGLAPASAGALAVRSRDEALELARGLLGGARHKSFRPALADAVALQAALGLLLHRELPLPALAGVFREAREKIERGIALPFSPLHKLPEPAEIVRESGIAAYSHLGRVLASEVRRLGETPAHTGSILERHQAGRFEQALRRGRAERGGGVVAEYKLASPSLGAFAKPVPLEVQLEAYQLAGADCFSVLAEPQFFQGSPAHVRRASRFEVPVLYKGFVLSPLHLREAADHGATAVLLIARVLRAHTAAFADAARALGLEPLVELHELDEADYAVEAGARLVGVNTRDLATFEVRDISAAPWRARFPDAVLIRESGVRTPADAREAFAGGFDAVLIGEALMRSDDPRQFVREIFQPNSP
jgi:anthranilate phosphoribosyltransferase